MELIPVIAAIAPLTPFSEPATIVIPMWVLIAPVMLLSLAMMAWSTFLLINNRTFGKDLKASDLMIVERIRYKHLVIRLSSNPDKAYYFLPKFGGRLFPNLLKENEFPFAVKITRDPVD